jgi:hypothetical protein
MARARRLLRIRLATGRSSKASPLWSWRAGWRPHEGSFDGCWQHDGALWPASRRPLPGSGIPAACVRARGRADVTGAGGEPAAEGQRSGRPPRHRSQQQLRRRQGHDRPDEPSALVLRSMLMAPAGMVVRSFDVQAHIHQSTRRVTVADRTLTRGPTMASPTRGSRCLMGRSIRRSRRVSSCTRMVPILGRVTDLGCPSPTRIPSRPLGPSCFGDERSRGAVLCVGVAGSRPGPLSRRSERALDQDQRRPPRTLGGDLRSPGEAGHLSGSCPIWCNREHAASTLTRLPAIECVDQVKA